MTLERLYSRCLAPTKKVKEEWVKERVKDILKFYKVYYFMPRAGNFGSSGVPDFVVCIAGMFLAIETKAGNNKPTDLQLSQIDKIRESRGTAVIINETNLHKLLQLIQYIIEKRSNDSKEQRPAISRS